MSSEATLNLIIGAGIGLIASIIEMVVERLFFEYRENRKERKIAIHRLMQRTRNIKCPR